MSEGRTLLFGDDSSPAADLAWAWIEAQRWPGWRVEVVTAADPLGPPPDPAAAELHPWEPPSPRRPRPSAALERIDHLTARLDPRLALSSPADLVVIGPRGPGLWKSLHLGSTAEWLLAHPPSPLVIARRGEPVRTVLAAHDGSSHSEAALAALAALPWLGDAAVSVVVVDDGRSAVADAAAAAQRRLPGAELLTRAGKPTAVIEGLLEERRPDLVALGTRGLTGIRRLRVGSTAAAVARAAPCSVLVACAEG
ncbi:MAG: universal stress protein [Acidimicrobiales bacterium]